MKYLDTLSKEIKEYFAILEPDFPQWLIEYINTEELLKQQYISITCGTIYSNLFKSSYFYSSLDHSVAVALICWHFTHDKKITLSGLFHDIATPVFKHCIDFLHEDYMQQDTTEELTIEILKNSKKIMTLLKRDGILLEEVSNYQLYPIADNDTPLLSSDRLEYTLSNALFTYQLTDAKTIKKIYHDIEIQTNEQQEQELGFRTPQIAMEFVHLMSKNSHIYIEDKTRFSMQLLADIITKRIVTTNEIANQIIKEILSSDMSNYIYLNFSF